MQMNDKLMSWLVRVGYWAKDLTDGVKSKLNSRKLIYCINTFY